MQFKRIPVKDILEASNSEELFVNYYSEGSMGLFKSPEVNKEIYYHLEGLGLLDSIGVYSKDILVGFGVATTSISPHYNKLVTTVMSIYVEPNSRKFGTANTLIKELEAIAKTRGSEVILVSSPVSKTMGKFVTKIGYVEANILYGKALR